MNPTKFFLNIDNLFLIALGLIIILGSVGLYNNLAFVLCIANVFAFSGFKLIRNEKINIPKNFWIYCIFLATLIGHYFIFGGEIFYFLEFLTGGFYWLVLYNSKEIAQKYFFLFLLFFCLIITALFLITHGASVSWPYSAENLFRPIIPVQFHNHIGDLTSILIVAVIYQMISKPKGWHSLVLIGGLVIVFLSFSRSAVLSLATGGVYILYLFDKEKFQKYLYILTVFVFIIFLYFGEHKTTIFARPYFLESIPGLIKYPLGTGIGGFSKITSDSSLTHNIILEICVGLGVFSFSFLMWIATILKSIYKNQEGILYKALFLAIFINFNFDTTYVIPGMIWLWFSVLALTSS